MNLTLYCLIYNVRYILNIFVFVADESLFEPLQVKHEILNLDSDDEGVFRPSKKYKITSLESAKPEMVFSLSVYNCVTNGHILVPVTFHTTRKIF